MIGILREFAGGRKICETCRAHGISEVTYHRWNAKYGGLASPVYNPHRWTPRPAASATS